MESVFNGTIGSYKVKVTLVQALRLCTGRTAHRGSRGIALPFHDHGSRRGEGSASRPDRFIRKKQIPIKVHDVIVNLSNCSQRANSVESCSRDSRLL